MSINGIRLCLSDMPTAVGKRVINIQYMYIIWITYFSSFHIGLCTGVNQTVREAFFAITKRLEYLLHICEIFDHDIKINL